MKSANANHVYSKRFMNASKPSPQSASSQSGSQPASLRKEMKLSELKMILSRPPIFGSKYNDDGFTGLIDPTFLQFCRHLPVAVMSNLLLRKRSARRKRMDKSSDLSKRTRTVCHNFPRKRSNAAHRGSMIL
eukprot:324183_1